MISWLKKHFIPHEGNNHRPHILRGSSARNIVILIIFLEIFSFLIPTFTRINTTGGMAAVLPAVLADLANEERQTQNLPALTISPILNEAAKMKAEDMAAKGYFAHTSPEGKTPWSWLEKVGYKYQYAGENLAINFSDSKDVTNAWMNSPTHKANIVKGNYTEVGTGIANGLYQEKQTVFVAQIYANPLPAFPQKTESKKVAVVNKVEGKNVLGAETVINPVFWQKLAASPRQTTNTALFFVFGIIATALFLNIFIKIKHHHPDLITNGLIVLVLIGAIFVANYYFSYHNMVISQGLDYSIENK